MKEKSGFVAYVVRNDGSKSDVAIGDFNHCWNSAKAELNFSNGALKDFMIIGRDSGIVLFDSRQFYGATYDTSKENFGNITSIYPVDESWGGNAFHGFCIPTEDEIKNFTNRPYKGLRS